jgi:TorA maturation chaperone TorD
VLISEGFKIPSENFVKEWKSPELTKYFYEVFKSLAYNIPLANYEGLAQAVKDIAEQRNLYYQSLEGKLLPVESIYRQWTFDRTAEVPFAKEKGYLMSDAALHMNALYQQYGLEIPEDYSGMPDHLCLEFEFMAFLVENETLEKQTLFLNEHLDWLEEFYQTAVEKGITGFYAILLKLAIAFTAKEREFLQKSIGH